MLSHIWLVIITAHSSHCMLQCMEKGDLGVFTRREKWEFVVCAKGCVKQYGIMVTTACEDMHSPAPSARHTHTHTLIDIQAPLPPHVSPLPLL